MTPTESGAILSVDGLSAGYGSIRILHEVTIDLRPGELVTIIGPNGAGKSTTLKAIVGLIRVWAGRVRFDGREITGQRPDVILRAGLAYVPQGRIVFPQMTVLENLEMGAYILSEATAVETALERVYALFPILRERQQQKAGTLSGGEQQMLAIARGLMTGPKVLLLDEPSLGLSPRNVSLIFDKIFELKAADVTMVVVEQNAARALAVADRGYVLELGKNRFEGTGPALLNDPDVKRLYLGG